MGYGFVATCFLLYYRLTLHCAEEVLQFRESFLGPFFLKEMAAIETAPRNR